MTCPRCSADLPDSATFCQKCGTSLRPNAFSYLPEGTPTWPTMVPQNTSYMTSVSSPVADTSAVGMMADKSAVGTINRPLRSGVQDEKSPTAPQPEKPRRSVRSTLFIVGVLLLSALIGGGASLGILWANGQLFPNNAAQTAVRVTVPTPTAASATPVASATPTQQGNQLPTPTSFQTLKITDLGISVKSPSDWQQIGPQPTSSNDMEVALVPPQSEQIGIALFIKRISATNSASLKSPAEANQQNITEFSTVSGVNNLKASATSQPTIAGVTWSEQDATFTSDQGDNYHYSTIAVQHNKLYYTISFYIPDVFHDEAVQKYIQPILNSFQFLS